MTDFTMITVDDGQGTTELHNAAQCAAAVAALSVKPDTPVVVYSGSKQKAMRAGDVPVFAALFAPAPAPPSPTAPPPAPAEAARGTSATKPVGPWTDVESYAKAKGSTATPASSPAATTATTTRTATTTVIEDDPAEDTAPATPTHPDMPPDNSGRNALIALGVVALVGMCSYAGRTPTDTKDATEASAEAAPAAEATVDPEADLPVETRYVRRPTNVQLQAGPGRRAQAKLDRGTMVTGVIVPGRPEWLHLRTGDYAGRYIWLPNLSPDSPPDLDKSFTGDRVASTTETIRVAPRSDAALVAGNSDVVPGRKLAVAGLVGGDWAEVLLTTGGVGYVPRSVFDAPAPTAEDAVDAAAMDAVAATMKDTAPRYDAAPAQRPTTNLRQILLANQCATSSMTVAIMYHNGDGWQTNEGERWTLRPNQSFYPAYGSRRLFADSDRIYYSVTAVNGRPAAQANPTAYYSYGTQRLGMRLAKLSAGNAGDYRVDIGC